MAASLNRVKGKLVAPLHQDGASLVARINRDERELLLAAAPKRLLKADS